MEIADFSQARLARHVGCSRQFINMLAAGTKHSCTPEISTLIEEALRVRPGTLFTPEPHFSRRG